jgi:hypothetical protein
MAQYVYIRRRGACPNPASSQSCKTRLGDEANAWLRTQRGGPSRGGLNGPVYGRNCGDALQRQGARQADSRMCIRPDDSETMKSVTQWRVT